MQWESTRLFESSYFSTQTWTWNIPVAVLYNNTIELPANLRYNVIFNSSTYGLIKLFETYTTINLAPECFFDNIPPKSSGIKLNGVYTQNCYCRSYINNFELNDRISTRIDDNPFGSGFQFFTTNFTNGLHVAEAKYTVSKGNEQVAAGSFFWEFDVLNTVRSVGQWVPNGFGSTYGVRISRAVDRALDGRFYWGDDNQRVYQFAAFGDSLDASVQSISVDEMNNIFIATRAVTMFKLLPDGTLDERFATGGIFLPFGYFGSLEICNTDYIRAIGDFIVINDSCNGRILKLSATTADFIAELLFPSGQPGYLSKPTTSGNILVSLEGSATNATIAEVNPSSFEIVRIVNIELEPNLKFGAPPTVQITGIAATESHWLIALQSRSSVLIVDPATAKVVGQWNGGGGPDSYIPTPGRFGSTVGDVLTLEDGSFVVLDVVGAALQRFNQTMLI
ncbi:hypothetical protein HDU76_000285 [Blyttiomyces sp. JEL0837]|nr:hypothetical protein HDU76_000285 [Blyttiomyces sp. JEL0837]